MSEFTKWLNEFTPRVKHVPVAGISELADELADQLMKFSAIGDQHAEAMTREFLHSTAETRIKAWSRNVDKVKTTIRGKVKAKPSRYSVTEVDTETGDLVGRKHRSFWDIPRKEFRDKMLAIDSQSMAMLDTRRVFHAVWDVWNQHPDAPTAREAWQSAGRSTEEINLDGAA